MRNILVIISSVFVVEKLISLVAPHYCVVCGNEGSVVCAWCLPDLAPPLPSRCFLCKKATQNSAVCQSCRRVTAIKHVWVRTFYEGTAKKLVHDLKFERRLAAVKPIARLMSESLPYLPADTIVAHVPTATSRVRKRGYDHAEKIARALAGHLNLRHEVLLARVSQTRQVGAKRAQRLSQMKGAFRPIGSQKLQKATILLVDDLTTTGATLEAAASCLKSAGAKTVNAVVFAQK